MYCVRTEMRQSYGHDISCPGLQSGGSAGRRDTIYRVLACKAGDRPVVGTRYIVSWPAKAGVFGVQGRTQCIVSVQRCAGRRDTIYRVPACKAGDRPVVGTRYIVSWPAKRGIGWSCGHDISCPGLQKRGCLECREGHNVLCPYRDAPVVGTRTIVSWPAKRGIGRSCGHELSCPGLQSGGSAGCRDTNYRVLACKSGGLWSAGKDTMYCVRTEMRRS
jgi:hypothetical protein